MDINYLLMREQVSLMRARVAASIEARMAHEGLARGYAARLRQSGYRHAAIPAAIMRA